MSNYKLIINENELDRFINILPDTTEDERYYITLLSRKKYDKTGLIKADRAQIKRVLAKKELIKDKIRQMEVAFGAYKFDDNPISEDSLALYISINPRSLHKAGLKLLKEISNKLYEGNLISPHTLSLNCVQTTASQKYWFDVDIDYTNIPKDKISVDHEVIKQIQRIIGVNQFDVISTRGGLHILVRLLENPPKTWYRDILKLKCDEFNIMMNKDGLVPLPGCRQGDFSPIII